MSLRWCILWCFIGWMNGIVAQQRLTWEVQHPISKKWIPLGEKGSVQEAFLHAGLLPDPFEGLNEDAYGWFENYTWKLRAAYDLSVSASRSPNIDLDFPSLDTYAAVYVNDSLIANTDNAFVHYRFPVRRLLHSGRNWIQVVFTPPVMFQKPRMSAVGTILPAPNDVGKVQVAPFCRKPQYQFGWDWSLRMLTMGFWEPVCVLVYTENAISGKVIRTLSLDDDQAKQQFKLVLAKPQNTTIRWESSLFGEKVIEPSGLKELVREESIQNPVLWWPRGQGEAHLYEDHWSVYDEQGTILLDTIVKFGIRKVELLQEKDQWGTSFLFKINGKPVFCKGADYIPDDIFPARITDSLLRSRVQTMAACHFNMIRIWGGGFYPRESFLDACDEAGIMVWQDFMFACAMYPGTEDFLATVKHELEQQIPRIASHPSVVYFNGNNEVDVAWKNWGFQTTYHLSGQNQRLIEKYYDRLFKKMIPDMVSAYTDNPYVHTSPLSNWGKDEFYRHGTQHYWGVWHGQDPLEDFASKAGRFNAEYGFQSFPEFYALSQFSDTTEWSLNSPVMQQHQKSYVGNGMIAKHADRLYGATEDFKRFVYYSQLTQAKAVGIAIASHRASFPRTSGTLYWQFNDCWPAPTWSSLDYYGQWKALQYEVRQDFQETAVVECVDSLGDGRFMLVQGNYDGFLCEIQAVITGLNGELLDSLSCRRALIGPQAVELFPQELAAWKEKSYLIDFRWNDRDGNRFHRVFARESSTTKRALPEEPVLEKIHFDPVTGNGTIRMKVTQAVLDLWLTHPTQPVHFEINFSNWEAGTYYLSFHAAADINVNDLYIFYR